MDHSSVDNLISNKSILNVQNLIKLEQFVEIFIQFYFDKIK